MEVHKNHDIYFDDQSVMNPPISLVTA